MSDPLIDREAFETLKSMTDAGFLVELIDVFLADTPDQIQQMRAALANGDKEVLIRAAHSLKSNSASFGANRLARLAREVELAAKEGALENAGAKIDALEAEYQKVAPALERLKDES